MDDRDGALAWLNHVRLQNGRRVVRWVTYPMDEEIVHLFNPSIFLGRSVTVLPADTRA
jgi:hypothetical protein